MRCTQVRGPWGVAGGVAPPLHPRLGRYLVGAAALGIADRVGAGFLLAALESLPDEPRHAARTLLAIGGKPRTTLTTRRAIAARPYGVGADRFARAYEDDVITTLAIALAERADPNATLPSSRPRWPPPPFRAARRRTA
ncbi:hypothetical protein [Pseudofrankia sp. BMG5.36]|uniref:hypothetical protein n=1 Tax=Pseudofrankia sp. BMG5.36 TaxID=1834512 RepID=UPI0008D9A07D|nr:hypothetical protein [Pseudofrankia sp. BMG5.36]OHV54294.1 hypothetical protein BCD48_09575 [Pseudofrankia sp. BMG5.36]